MSTAAGVGKRTYFERTYFERMAFQRMRADRSASRESHPTGCTTKLFF